MRIVHVASYGLDLCRCDHTRVWHTKDGRVCEFHCGNPERCQCTGFERKR